MDVVIKILNWCFISLLSLFGFEPKPEADFFDEELETPRERMARFGDFVRKEKEIKEDVAHRAENLDDIPDIY